MSNNDIIDKLSSPETQKFLKACSIQNLRLFGSRAKNNFTDDSDVDLLYKIDNSASRKNFAFFRGISYLKDLLQKDIDMVSIDYIDADIRSEVLASKITVW